MNIIKSLSDKEKTAIKNIQKYLTKIAKLNDGKNSKKISLIHEKIDSIIHAISGKEGLTFEEKKRGISKGLEAGNYNIAPTERTDGAALGVESLDSSKKKKKKKKLTRHNY